MTEKELRQQVVSKFKEYKGATKGSSKHKALIDTYNTITPLPAGYKMTYTDAWCAATVSAIGFLCGLQDYIFPECSCSRMIELYKKVGRWKEDDKYTPEIGDLIMYDWEDSKTDYATTDNTGAPDHVGMIIAISGTSMTVLEGNMGTPRQVGTRAMKMNGRYIRGYCLPDYKTAASALTKQNTKPTTSTTTDASTTPITYKRPTIRVPVLCKGHKGTSVLVLQHLLAARGLSTNGLDGDFGSGTLEALKTFQKSAGLSPSGVATEATWRALIEKE